MPGFLLARNTYPLLSSGRLSTSHWTLCLPRRLEWGREGTLVEEEVAKKNYVIKLQNISKCIKMNITRVFYFKVELRLEGDFGAFNV